MTQNHQVVFFEFFIYVYIKTQISLKRKKLSPWFLNIGDFNDGVTLSALADAYAKAIINSGVQLDTLYGIPEKGVGLVGPVAAKMGERGHNVGWFFTRK